MECSSDSSTEKRPFKAQVKYRNSYGIALVRYNAKRNHRMEVLLIKRRMTYHFYSFVMGHYHIRENDQFLKYLFDNMTVSEKLDILNMNFDTIWYRAWLYNPEKDYRVYSRMLGKQSHFLPNWRTSSVAFTYKNYRKKKAKFDTAFGKNPNRLRQLLHQSQNVEALWDIPKGRVEVGETHLDTAIREFYEETAIPASSYYIDPSIPPVVHTYKDQDVVYVNTFYVALLRNPNWTPRLNFSSGSQMCETEYMKWVSMTEIDFLNMNKKLAKQLYLTFDKIKQRAKGDRRRFQLPTAVR